jgi:hypothetical protein
MAAPAKTEKPKKKCFLPDGYVFFIIQSKLILKNFFVLTGTLNIAARWKNPGIKKTLSQNKC